MSDDLQAPVLEPDAVLPPRPPGLERRPPATDPIVEAERLERERGAQLERRRRRCR